MKDWIRGGEWGLRREAGDSATGPGGPKSGTSGPNLIKHY